MPQKPLLVGARPVPYEGPWVDLDGRSWDVVPSRDCQEDLAVRVVDANGDVSEVYPRVGCTVCGVRAQAVILREFDSPLIFVRLELCR